ncbi:hypothetical protein E3Q10_01784 [Wallemia mellicola]|uniref:Uncharacterized protein n=1 Tax=Wallemia mellicola TaxID=1708541 RepID=A0A4V4N451_9BASI|nr:hypothetical protein E3Q15_01755 [Wallemia mellicola]TIC31124.1 hypothetical protein E3Q10_01784 [Wallemia mellicola]TIC67493.1 hypothetical protein E3Q01_01259 [Wallemia mellicola]
MTEDVMMISREEEEVEKQKDEEMAAILEEIRLNEECETNDNSVSKPSTSVEQANNHIMSKKEGKKSEYAQPTETLDETYQYDEFAPGDVFPQGIEDADNVNENENQEQTYEAQLKAAIEASLKEQ